MFYYVNDIFSLITKINKHKQHACIKYNDCMELIYYLVIDLS